MESHANGTFGGFAEAHRKRISLWRHDSYRKKSVIFASAVYFELGVPFASNAEKV